MSVDDALAVADAGCTHPTQYPWDVIRTLAAEVRRLSDESSWLSALPLLEKSRAENLSIRFELEHTRRLLAQKEKTARD